jgi:hypothetical protein
LRSHFSTRMVGPRARSDRRCWMSCTSAENCASSALGASNEGLRSTDFAGLGASERGGEAFGRGVFRRSSRTPEKLIAAGLAPGGLNVFPKRRRATDEPVPKHSGPPDAVVSIMPRHLRTRV